MEEDIGVPEDRYSQSALSILIVACGGSTPGLLPDSLLRLPRIRRVCTNSRACPLIRVKYRSRLVMLSYIVFHIFKRVAWTDGVRSRQEKDELAHCGYNTAFGQPHSHMAFFE